MPGRQDHCDFGWRAHRQHGLSRNGREIRGVRNYPQTVRSERIDQHRRALPRPSSLIGGELVRTEQAHDDAIPKMAAEPLAPLSSYASALATGADDRVDRRAYPALHRLGTLRYGAAL